MNKIEFRAGYYEWLIIINDKLIATTSYPQNDTEPMTKDFVEGFADMLIDDLKDVAKDYERNDKQYFEYEDCADIFNSLSKAEIKKLRDLMSKSWEYLYD